MSIEPHVLSHNSQVSKFFDYREILQFTVEVLKVGEVRVKLVLEVLLIFG
jgi:hypothetical protein